MNLCDRNEIQELLRRHGFRFSKSMGQNFLIESWVPEDIAAASGADRQTGVLEIGPGIGPLTQQLARRAGKVASVELDRRLYPVLRETMADFDNFTLLEGDATEILHSLTGSYDLIFMDAAKGQYIHFLPDVLRLLAPGGVLLSDNVLQDGDIIESRFAVERRNRTIHSRMREYLYALTHTPGITTSVLPMGDGLTLTVKGEDYEQTT